MTSLRRKLRVYPFLLATLCLWIATATGGAAYKEGRNFPPFVWPSEPPKDCPFEPSKDIVGIAFLGVHSDYHVADTWYPSWASDGNLYSPWTDGSAPRADGSRESSNSGIGKDATTGQAVLIGDDPLTLKIVSLGLFKGDASPYKGRYPCGSLVYNNVWYYGTYCLAPDGKVNYGTEAYNWPWLGPFVGFRYSTDFGKTWTDTPHTPAKPLFGETGMWGYPVKIGAPHFVDFGRNMEHSPDGKAYSRRPRRPGARPQAALRQPELDQRRPDLPAPRHAEHRQHERRLQVRVLRRPRCPRQTRLDERLRQDPAADRLEQQLRLCHRHLRRPAEEVPDVRHRRLAHLRQDEFLHPRSNEITGPWRLVTYMKEFGEQGYFLNIPTKFISPDGRTAWLCYSGNFAKDWRGAVMQEKPPGSHYGLVLQQIRLLDETTRRKYSQ